MWQKLCILLLPFLNIEAKIVVVGLNKNHEAFADSALLLTERFISSKSNTVVIQEKCSNCGTALQHFNNRILERYLKSVQGIVSVQLFFGKNDSQPWNYNIFIVDSTKAFSEIRRHIPKTVFEREFYFIVIMTYTIHDRRERKREMRRIFKVCIQMRVINVVILHQDITDNSIVFYTFSMAGSYCGTSISIEEVNRYRDGKLENDTIFSNSQTNFHGCTFNVTARRVDPILQFNGDYNNRQHLSQIDRLNGLEGEMLRLLADALNFTVALDFPKEESSIFVQRQSTGCFEELDAGIADLAVGSFFSSDDSTFKFSMSLSHHQTLFVVVVRSGLHFGPLKQLANPFRGKVWMCILITFVFAFVLFRFIDCCEDARVRDFILGVETKCPNTNMMIIFLGNPINKPPRRNFARFLLMCWLLATLILRNAYQGKLFDSLRISRRIPTPKAIEELIQNNYKLLSPKWLEYYPQNMTEIMPNMYKRLHKIDSSQYSRYAGYTLLETLASYNLINWNSSRLTYVDEPIFSVQLVMYFQKHSVLKLIFDNKIRQLISSGIMANIAKRYSRSTFQKMNKGQRILPSISNDMLSGLYTLYGILMGVALLFFILELLSLRVKMLQRLFHPVACETNKDIDQKCVRNKEGVEEEA